MLKASMSETRTEREPRLLQSIPQDILRQIASLIDKRSAQALATTCKSLREAGEMRIWERIRLLHFAPEGERHRLLLETREARILQALQSHPLRASYCDELVIEPYRKAQTQQVEILDMTHTHLITLAIDDTRFTSSDTTGPLPELGSGTGQLTETSRAPKNVFLFAILEKGMRFERLRDFRLAMDELCTGLGQVNQLWRKMPLLKSLEILPRESWNPDPPMTDRLLPADMAEVPYFPELVHLSVESMTRGFAGMLRRILLNAPRLKHLALAGTWFPKPSDTTLDAIRQHRGLEVVSWFAPGREPARQLFDGSTRQHLTTLVQTRADGGEDWECGLTGSKEDCTRYMLPVIPKIEKVQKYVVLLWPRPSPSDYARAGVEPYPYFDDFDPDDNPRMPAQTPRGLAYTLKNAPDLTEIHFGHKYSDDHFPSHYKLRRPSVLDGPGDAYEPWGWFKPTVPPRDWERVGWRGAIIRTFSRPAQRQRELVHIRVLSRSSTIQCEVVYIGTMRRWTHLAFYSGQPFDLDQLADVCSLADIPYHFLEGGRNLDLPDNAWEALDAFHNQQDPMLQLMALDTESWASTLEEDLNNPDWEEEEFEPEDFEYLSHSDESQSEDPGYGMDLDGNALGPHQHPQDYDSTQEYDEEYEQYEDGYEDDGGW